MPILLWITMGRLRGRLWQGLKRQAVPIPKPELFSELFEQLLAALIAAVLLVVAVSVLCFFVYPLLAAR